MLREPMYFVPESMGRWNLEIRKPMTVSPHTWSIVSVEQASLELHHEVLLIDENERPIDSWVMFGYPGGDGNSLPIRVFASEWRDYPKMNGNPQYTLNGYARHTFNDGGEHIYVVEALPSEKTTQGLEIFTPSDILVNCSWLSSTEAGVRFLHTGVRVTFQRQRIDVPIISLEDIETRLSNLEEQMADLFG